MPNFEGNGCPIEGIWILSRDSWRSDETEKTSGQSKNIFENIAEVLLWKKSSPVDTILTFALIFAESKDAEQNINGFPLIFRVL